MAGTIFINYRRAENLKDAQHLATLLGKRFGEKRIFIDERGIGGGEHWLHTLEKQVAASDAMVALIGKGWVDLKDDEGNRRLDSAEDFVRFEIAQALQRGIPILPVLLDGAQIPKAAQLPANIMALSHFQAMRLRSESVVPDAEAIAEQLKVMLSKRRPRGVPIWAAVVGAAFLVTVGVAAGPLVLGQLGLVPAVAPTDLQKQLEIARGDLAMARKDVERSASAVQERDQARSALTKANQRVDDLQKAMDAANNDIAKVREETERLRTAVQERDQARSLLARANQRVVDLQKVVDASNSDVTKAREEIQRLRPAVQDRDQARSELANANQTIAELRKQADAAASVTGGDPALAVTPGSRQGFQDRLANGQPCSFCPEMVVMPRGTFTMGSLQSEPEREQAPELKGSESPQLKVSIESAFAVGRLAITRAEFAAFARETGHKTDNECFVSVQDAWTLLPNRSWLSPGFQQDDRHPVVCVNWDDANAYVRWISYKTGRRYRLLSNAEREYVTRAGTTTPFWWGQTISPLQANYDGNTVYAGGGVKGEYRRRTVAAESFAPNPWGLFNVHGNVWEWVADCWSENHQRNAGDGSATIVGDCGQRALRGGSWRMVPSSLRSAGHNRSKSGSRVDDIGFRLARTIDR